jgi:hypothetical protein
MAGLLAPKLVLGSTLRYEARLQRLGINHRRAVRPEAKLDERTRVGNYFGLPAVVCLVAGHGFLRCLSPDTVWFSVEIFFADQRLLNFTDAAGFDASLAPRPPGRPVRSARLAGNLPRYLLGAGVRGGRFFTRRAGRSTGSMCRN